MVKEEDKPTTVHVAKAIKNKSYNKNVGNSSKNDYYYYCLTRETQGDLDAIVSLGFMIDSKAFLKDDLMCEWAYIINLDSEKLDVYTGIKLVVSLPLFENLEATFKEQVIDRDEE